MISVIKTTLANTPSNTDPVEVLIPKGREFMSGRVSEFRDIETDSAQYDMWFVVDTDTDLEKVYLKTIMTGGVWPEDGFYLGTYEAVPGIDLHVIEVPAPNHINLGQDD